MDMRELTLAHPKVQAVVRRWYKVRKGPKSAFTPGFFLKKLKAGRSLSDIARSRDRTPEAARQYYKRFRELLNGQTGRERQRALTEKRRVIQEARRERLLKSSNNWKCPPVVRRARIRGYEVHLIRKTSSGMLANVNGWRCLVHRAACVFVYQGHAYYRYAITTSGLDHAERHFFYGAADGFSNRLWIVPTRMLKKRFRGKRHGTLYQPVKKKVVRGKIRPKVDLWRFENAWHLLQ